MEAKVAFLWRVFGKAVQQVSCRRPVGCVLGGEVVEEGREIGMEECGLIPALDSRCHRGPWVMGGIGILDTTPVGLYMGHG